MDYPQAIRILHDKIQAESITQHRNHYIIVERQRDLIRALTNIGNADAVAALLDLLRRNYRAYEVLLSLRHVVARHLSIIGDVEQKDFWLGILKTEPMMTLVLSHRGDLAVDTLLAAVQCLNRDAEGASLSWDEAWRVAEPDEEILHTFIQALWDSLERYQALLSIKEIVAWLLGQIHVFQCIDPIHNILIGSIV